MLPECGMTPHRVSEYCAATVSSIANLGLIFLILFRTSKELRVYSRVLLANCLIDLFFTTTSFVIDAHWLINSGWLFIVHNGFIRATSPDHMYAVFAVYQLALYTSILSITLPFIYRYFLICRRHTMRSWSFLLVNAFNVLFAALVPLSCRIWLYPEMKSALVEDPLIAERLPCRHAGGQIPYMRMSFTLETLIPTTVVAALSSYTYAVILGTSYMIWKTLGAQARLLSQRTASLHRQLNRMLLVQALSPFIVAVVPLVMTCAVIYNGTENAETLAYVNTAMSWIPVISPLSALYFVKDYRDTILGLLMLKASRTTPFSEGLETDPQ